MKTGFLVMIFSVLSPETSAHSMSMDNLKFIPMKRFEQADGLPPKLIAVFDLDCNETLVKTIRHEVEGPVASSTLHIFVGALVSESLLSSCAGMIKEVKAEAGTTFSGRSFEVHPILQGSPPAPPKVVSTGVPPRSKPAKKQEQK